MRTILMNKILTILAGCLLAVSLRAGTTVLWDESVNGTLKGFPYEPTNNAYVVHPVGNATDDVNVVRGFVTLVPMPGYPGNFIAYEDAIFFYISTGRQLTGLSISASYDFPGYVWGGFCSTTNGVEDGTGDIGPWEDDLIGTNNLLASFNISSLPGGPYSINIIPNINEYAEKTWTNSGTANYTLAILTAPASPALQISPTDNQLLVSWSTNATGFILQSSSNLGPPAAWLPVSPLPVVAADQFVVTNTMVNGSQFFRLIHQ
jgi:hypothetical protein